MEIKVYAVKSTFMKLIVFQRYVKAKSPWSFWLIILTFRTIRNGFERIAARLCKAHLFWPGSFWYRIASMMEIKTDDTWALRSQLSPADISWEILMVRKFHALKISFACVFKMTYWEWNHSILDVEVKNAVYLCLKCCFCVHDECIRKFLHSCQYILWDDWRIQRSISCSKIIAYIGRKTSLFSRLMWGKCWKTHWFFGGQVHRKR